MSDVARNRKRGPVPSWKLGSTRAIRVPIVLADALLNLARRIDNNEITLTDAFLTSNKQVSRVMVAQGEGEKDLEDEHKQKKDGLASMHVEAKARYAIAHANFVEARSRFATAQKTLFRHCVKREK